MDMVGSYPVLDGAVQAGILEVRTAGAYLRFRAVCRSERREVFRLAVRDGTRTVPLGVMTPAGSGWQMDRRFSPAELRRMELTKLDECILLPASVWQPEPNPARLFRDETLRRAARGIHDALIRADGADTRLAVPLRSDAPFPAMPIFCFGETEEIEGAAYVVFGVSGGELVL